MFEIPPDQTENRNPPVGNTVLPARSFTSRLAEGGIKKVTITLDKSKLGAILAGIFIIAGVGVLGFVAFRQGWFKPKNQASALSVNSLFGELEVSLDGENMGKTPYYSDALKAGKVSLLLTGDQGSFSTQLTLNPGTMTVVNRAVGPSETFSAGEIIWLEPTADKKEISLSVISSPEGAKVFIDGTAVGLTPLTTNQITAGEHSVKVSKDGFAERIVKVKTQEGYRLNISSQLILKPFPSGELQKISKAETSRWTVFDLSLDGAVPTDPASWAKGVVFWQDLFKATTPVEFEYLVDALGGLYDKSGDSTATSSAQKKETEEVFAIGYLGKKGEEITPEAMQVLSGLAQQISGEALAAGAQVEIQETGTGWLRVRSEPGLTGTEVTKVNVGEKFPLLEEKSGWYKIKLSDGQEGWVISQYATKL